MEDQETRARSSKLSEPPFFHLQKKGVGLDDLKDPISSGIYLLKDNGNSEAS